MLRIAIVVLLLLLAPEVHADLLFDANTLIDAWTTPHSSAQRVATVFVHEGEVRRVAYPDQRTTERPCVTLVAMAERHVRFAVSTGIGREPMESRAGVVRVNDCGGGELTGPAGERRLAVSIVRGRGAVEIVSASFSKALPGVHVVLPSRAVGLVSSEAASPGALPLAPHGERVSRASVAARLDGAETTERTSLDASADGSGTLVLELESGCHRVVVLADARLADVDAEALREDDGTALQRDRSHAPDARLEFCLGTSERVLVRSVGAPGGSKLTVLSARWPAPAGVPTIWGAEARAGLSWALFRRHAPAPRIAPEFQALGAGGATVLPVPVEPGRCYVAAFAVGAGKATAGRLSLRLGASAAYDDASDVRRSAAVSFCAGPFDDLAVLTVDLRSRDAWWVLALFRMGGP
jgi:hypothetical protein